jgi:hypothetical protein
MKLLFLALLLAISTAHAYTGKELREDCQAAEEIYADRNADPFRSPRAARCVAYIEGFADGYAVSDHLAGSVGVKLDAFCLPTGRDLSFRLVRAVLAQLDRQPVNTDTGTAALVASALSRSFPCSAPLERGK